MPKIRTRIAPSPTGDWHLGTARTALFTYLFARQSGGKFYLRVEDTDQNRLIEDAIDRILEVMNWLGLDTDDFGGQKFITQSERLDRYQEVVKQLVADGKAYYCFATSEQLQAMRDEQSAAKQAPRYDNRWGYRDMALVEAQERVDSGEPYVIRQKMLQSGTITVNDTVHGDVTVGAATLDDHVLLKADGFPTYHLAHIVDDHDMGITHVIRGDEWLPSAPRHVALINALGWELPTYVHLPVILGTDKGKLSKRHGAKSVLEYRDSGYLVEAVRNYLLFLGWSSGNDNEIYSLPEMLSEFSLERVQPNPAKFDPQKLNWFNAEYIKTMPRADLVKNLKQFWPKDDIWLGRIGDSVKCDAILDAIVDRMTTLADFERYAAVFYVSPTHYEATSLAARGQEVPEAKTMLGSILEVLQGLTDWSHDSLKTKLDGLVASKNVKVGHVYLPLRYALTGLVASPGALECLVILGRDESLKRIETCLNSLS